MTTSETSGGQSRSYYTVAGVDLGSFVESWLTDVEARAGTGLLHEANVNEIESDRYFYGMAGLMSEIAPLVMGDDGSNEELLLYAVLASSRPP